MGCSGMLVSKYVPKAMPMMLSGIKVRTSRQLTCRKFTPLNNMDAEKSSSSMSGTTNVSGSHKANTGMAIKPEPKPDTPRIK